MNAGQDRIAAIDAFRGLTIAAMILVNTPGSWVYVYRPLSHAAWNGCSGADFVFPFFLFISGASTWFSLAKRSGTGKAATVKKIFVRSAILFMIGLFLNAYPFTGSFSTLRFAGVLQRIAVVYCAGALLGLYLDRLKLALLSMLILLGYWLFLLMLGGEHPYDLETNIAGIIDRSILGEKHLWAGKGTPFDPEGILTTFPATVTFLGGYLSASFLDRSRRGRKAAGRLILASFTSASLGLLWSRLLPVNKSLWTGSYVLVTSGAALMLLVVLFLIIDIEGHRKWAVVPIVFGVNSIFIYVVSSLWVKTLVNLVRLPGGEGGTVSGYGYLYNQLFVPLAGKWNGSLLFGVSHLALYWAVLFILYRKRIFIKI